MTDPTERLEHFATNDTAHGGDCETPRDALWQGDELDEMAEDVEQYLDSLPYDEPTPDQAMRDVLAHLSAVKRFGLALQQLGRPCDAKGDSNER